MFKGKEFYILWLQDRILTVHSDVTLVAGFTHSVLFSVSYYPLSCSSYLSCSVMLCYALSCSVMLCYALSCSVMLCHALSCSVMHFLSAMHYVMHSVMHTVMQS